MPSRSGSNHERETLEVEDVEQRQRRLRMYSHFPHRFSPSLSAEDILERLNGEGSSTEQSPNLSFDFGVRRTFATEPPDECAPSYYPPLDIPSQLTLSR